MIQFNLLPSVKMEYIRARRTKRKVLLSASVVVVVSLFFVVVLVLAVYVWQALRLRGLDKSIKEAATELREQNDIDKVLTVQNQLKAIDALHESKPEVGRIFGYLSQVTPSALDVTSYTVDFSEFTMSIVGRATDLEDVNKYVDTLKFTEMSTGAEGEEAGRRPFSQVVLSSYGREANTRSPKTVTYTITLMYDETIFKSTETNLTLTVPKISTTRSETEQPTDLFKSNDEGTN